MNIFANNTDYGRFNPLIDIVRLFFFPGSGSPPGTIELRYYSVISYLWLILCFFIWQQISQRMWYRCIQVKASVYFTQFITDLFPYLFNKIFHFYGTKITLTMPSD